MNCSKLKFSECISFYFSLLYTVQLTTLLQVGQLRNAPFCKAHVQLHEKRCSWWWDVRKDHSMLSYVSFWLYLFLSDCDVTRMQGCFTVVYGYFIYLFNVILKCGFTGFEKLMMKQLSHPIEFTGDLDGNGQKMLAF